MSSEIFLTIFISFVTPLLLFIVLVKKKSEDLVTRNLPPGPKKLPIIGNLHQLGKFPHRSLQKLSKTYGDPMMLQLGSVPVLIVSSADIAREILKTHDLAFSGRPASLYVVKKITYNLSSISFAPYGEYWREVRRIAVLELLSLKRVQSFHKIRAREVALLIDRIMSTISATNHVNLSSLTFSLSNDVVCGVAFGTTCSDDHGNSRFQELLIQMQQLSAEFNVADYFPWMAWINRFNGVDQRLDRNFRDIDEFFNKVIEEHSDPDRVKPGQDDIIDVLLRIQKDPDQGFALKNEHIKGVLMDIFVAGTDTSSATIVWTMAELMRNPKVKERVEEEVRRVCKGKAKVEENDLQKLSYLKQVIKESLRLHPPAPLMLPRETIENCIIDNKYEIPIKTRVILNASAIGSDPKYWENPEKFWPERFSNSETDFRGQHFELLPFGAGRRGCPGINFSISIVELALANLFFFYDWELPQGISAENIDMEEALGITIHKKIPLCLVASPVNV